MCQIVCPDPEVVVAVTETEPLVGFVSLKNSSFFLEKSINKYL